MKRWNCFFHAIPRHIRQGGWIIGRRSWGGLFLHFAHAKDLPEDLKVSQYVPNEGVACSFIFEGHVEETLGSVKPPPVTGSVDWGLLLFWVTYCIGWYTTINWLWSLGKAIISRLIAFL